MISDKRRCKQTQPRFSQGQSGAPLTVKSVVHSPQKHHTAGFMRRWRSFASIYNGDREVRGDLKGPNLKWPNLKRPNLKGPNFSSGFPLLGLVSRFLRAKRSDVCKRFEKRKTVYSPQAIRAVEVLKIIRDFAAGNRPNRSPYLQRNFSIDTSGRSVQQADVDRIAGVVTPGGDGSKG